MTIELIQGDCIEEMTKMQKESVDLTVTSPPYDNLRTYEGSLQWNENIWKQVLEGLYRVTKEGGVVVWVVGDATIKGSETGTSFKQALYAIKLGFNLHDTMIWQKDTFSAVGALKTRYAPVFEYMFVFSKGKISTFNPIKDRKNKYAGDTVHGKIRQSDGSTKDMSGKHVKKIAEFGQRWNVWKQSAQRQRGKDCHPAPFPEQLAHDHIKSWSNEGDTVFDPFLGSGTTGVAAKQLERSFIGIEKVNKYFEIAKERIDNDY
jgi:DNA modification methylase|tara:strand:- start:693 stop:1475 length:783 start_codon:yes stop_codon:yes gene_type:complete